MNAYFGKSCLKIVIGISIEYEKSYKNFSKIASRNADRSSSSLKPAEQANSEAQLVAIGKLLEKAFPGVRAPVD